MQTLGTNPSMLANDMDIKKCDALVSNRTYAQEQETRSIPSTVVPTVVFY